MRSLEQDKRKDSNYSRTRNTHKEAYMICVYNDSSHKQTKVRIEFQEEKEETQFKKEEEVLQ